MNTLPIKTQNRIKYILESMLFQKALEYGGYNKIPIKDIQLVVGIIYATIILLSIIEWIGEIR